MQKRRFADISVTWTLSGLALAACGGGGGGGGGGLGGSAVSVRFDGDYIVGTPSADNLNGTPRRDIIIDDAGKNTVYGNGGNDYIIASGNVDGGSGNDFIFHNNVVANNQIYGGDGHDVIATEYGSIEGGDGNDFIQINNDNGERADFLQRDVFQVSAENTTISKDELFQFVPFSEIGNGVTRADAGDGNDIIFVHSAPGSGNCHDLRGGRGDDQIITTHDAIITGGTGSDEFGITILFDDGYSVDLKLTIVDFETGSDKIVFIYDPDEISISLGSLDDIKNLDASFDSKMIDADSDGENNDNEITFLLRSQITNKEVSYTLLIKNVDQALTDADFDFMTFNDAAEELRDIQQNYIDMF